MRPHLEFVDGNTIPFEQVSHGPFAGVARRPLSEDRETGAATAVLALPAGWSGSLERLERLIELYVLEGELTADGERLRRGGYLRSERDVRLVATAETRALVMLEPLPPVPPAGDDWLALDTDAMPWLPPSHGGPSGICVKTLWAREGRGPITLLASNVHRYDSGPEFHECPEEIYVVSGDVGDGSFTATAGWYLWRPEYVTHGPYHSEQGLLVFLRGHGELWAHWIDDPNATVAENRAYANALRRDT